jgi:hypothetical protein
MEKLIQQKFACFTYRAYILKAKAMAAHSALEEKHC